MIPNSIYIRRILLVLWHMIKNDSYSWLRLSTSTYLRRSLLQHQSIDQVEARREEEVELRMEGVGGKLKANKG